MRIKKVLTANLKPGMVVAEADGLNLIPGTRGRRREPILKSCLSDLYTHTVACAWPKIPSKGFRV